MTTLLFSICVFSFTDFIARKIGSGFMTIPAPPPYGVSSTWLCLLNAKSRGLVMAISKIFFSIARLVILAPNTPPNISGNKDKISILISLSYFLIFVPDNFHIAILYIDFGNYFFQCWN